MREKFWGGRQVLFQTKSSTRAEGPVSDADHVRLSRLVTEHESRADHGVADAIHELYVDHGELTNRVIDFYV